MRLWTLQGHGFEIDRAKAEFERSDYLTIHSIKKPELLLLKPKYEEAFKFCGTRSIIWCALQDDLMLKSDKALWTLDVPENCILAYCDELFSDRIWTKQSCPTWECWPRVRAAASKHKRKFPCYLRRHTETDNNIDRIMSEENIPIANGVDSLWPHVFSKTFHGEGWSVLLPSPVDSSWIVQRPKGLTTAIR